MWITSATSNDNDRLLRMEQVMEIVGVCRSVIYSMMQEGKFPQKVTVGTRGARWSERQVRKWLADRVAESIAKGNVARHAPATDAPDETEGWPQQLTVTHDSNVSWAKPTTDDAEARAKANAALWA